MTATAGTNTAICPLVQNPNASPKAAPRTFINFLCCIQTTNCQIEKTIQAVRIASILTSLLARINANEEASMSADNFPTASLYNIFPKRYVE